MQKKPENSRLNLFYILYALKKNTDEEHPVSATELSKLINDEFGYLSVTGKAISHDTVKRTLDDFIEKIFPIEANMQEYKQKYGYYIGCITEAKEENKSYKYYYYASDFSLAEIRTLKDAIETYNYFSEEDITDIITKLIRIRPKSFPKDKYYDVAKMDREEDSLLLMNIDILNEIINRKNKARIIYCAYDINKKLVPRSGYPKVVEPIHLMWSNGYYYLLINNKKHSNIVSLRVDRITFIEEVEGDNEKSSERFNPVQYRFEHPIMYAGDKEKMVLLCRDTEKDYIMNTIMDVFGKSARVTKAEDEILQKYLGADGSSFEKEGINWLKVTVEAATSGVELWATQYCDECIIISPEESRIRVKERLKSGLDYYDR